MIAPGLAAAPSWAAIDWNDELIAWYDLEQGLRLARAEGKPAVVVLYANWCATCHAYRHIFENQSVLAASTDFVMIRVDADNHPAINRKFGYDGLYLPRVFLLAPGGKVLNEIYATDRAFRYFIRPDRPDVLTMLMNRAAGELDDRSEAR
jgi:thiol-disulfide isomerase/thioredoxin